MAIASATFPSPIVKHRRQLFLLPITSVLNALRRHVRFVIPTDDVGTPKLYFCNCGKLSKNNAAKWLHVYKILSALISRAVETF